MGKSIVRIPEGADMMIDGLFARSVVKTINGGRSDAAAISTIKAIQRDMNSALSKSSLLSYYDKVKKVMGYMRKESVSVEEYVVGILREATGAIASKSVNPDSMPRTLEHYKAVREMGIEAGSRFSKKSGRSVYRRL